MGAGASAAEEQEQLEQYENEVHYQAFHGSINYFDTVLRRVKL